MSNRSRLLLGLSVLAAFAALDVAHAQEVTATSPGDGGAVAGASEGDARPPGTGPLHRLGRGVVNMVIAPLEIPATMLRVAGQTNAVFGILAGGAEGIGNGLVRFGAGALETVTAPIPSDGLPLYGKPLGSRALPILRPPTQVTRP